jgi:hypothetical protein
MGNKFLEKPPAFIFRFSYSEHADSRFLRDVGIYLPKVRGVTSQKPSPEPFPLQSYPPDLRNTSPE